MHEQTMQEKTQRKPWVDVLRALAILFVMYGHLVKPGTAFYVFTSPIKIPLFFAISGYVFNPRNGNVKAFFLKVCTGLLIPWLVLSLCQVVLYIPSRGFGYIGQYILNVLTGVQYWYMPCCILAEILFFLLLKFLKREWQRIVAVLALTATGLLLADVAMFDLFKINTAMIAQSYLLIGYSIRKSELQVSKIKGLWLFIGAVIYFLLGVVSLQLFPGQSLDVNTNSYYNLPWCGAMIVLGCFLMFALFPRLRWLPKTLCVLGQNTLVFYLFHNNVITVLAVLGFVLPSTWWGGLTKLLIACVFCGILAALLNRVLPEVVGKKRKPKIVEKEKTVC